MGLPAATAKTMARIILEETGSKEKAENIISRWNDVSGLNGNFKMVISDVLTFVRKIGGKIDT